MPMPDERDEAKNPHAVALGRLGGSVTSERKAAAARENLVKAAAAALLRLRTDIAEAATR